MASDASGHRSDGSHQKWRCQLGNHCAGPTPLEAWLANCIQALSEDDYAALKEYLDKEQAELTASYVNAKILT